MATTTAASSWAKGSRERERISRKVQTTRLIQTAANNAPRIEKQIVE
jgi:hypothetical protein